MTDKATIALLCTLLIAVLGVEQYNVFDSARNLRQERATEMQMIVQASQVEMHAHEVMAAMPEVVKAVDIGDLPLRQASRGH